MPEKTIYMINAKGEAYFLELMEKYSRHPANIYIDFTAVISNLGKVEKKSGNKSSISSIFIVCFVVACVGLIRTILWKEKYRIIKTYKCSVLVDNQHFLFKFI